MARPALQFRKNLRAVPRSALPFHGVGFVTNSDASETEAHKENPRTRFVNFDDSIEINTQLRGQVPPTAAERSTFTTNTLARRRFIDFAKQLWRKFQDDDSFGTELLDPEGVCSHGLPLSITTIVMSSVCPRLFPFWGHASTASSKRSANRSAGRSW